jgi:DDE superfamily endonuclease
MERLNALRFVDLLTHFMRGRKSPVFLIVDGHPTHIVKVVAQYVQRLAGRLELHFLRGYAQELNPDEFVSSVKSRSKTPLRRDNRFAVPCCRTWRPFNRTRP